MPGGFGERGAEGKIRAAQFARERHVPYFGICFGMQMAVIEAARNLCGIEEANSTEFGPTTEPVVGLMTEWMQGQRAGEARARDGDLGGTMRLGAYPARLRRGSRVAGDLRRRRRSPSATATATRSTPPTRTGWSSTACASAGMSPDGLLPEIDRIRGPSLVHRRAVPPRAEVAPVRAAPAVRVVHRRGGGAVAAGIAASQMVARRN